MTAATVAFLTPVSRLSTGVYSSVAAALSAMTMRRGSSPCSSDAYAYLPGLGLD